MVQHHFPLCPFQNVFLHATARHKAIDVDRAGLADAVSATHGLCSMTGRNGNAGGMVGTRGRSVKKKLEMIPHEKILGGGNIYCAKIDKLLSQSAFKTANPQVIERLGLDSPSVTSCWVTCGGGVLGGEMSIVHPVDLDCLLLLSFTTGIGLVALLLGIFPNNR